MTTAPVQDVPRAVSTTVTAPDIPYVCYHRHSCVSNILLADSVATNDDYARRAVELGHSVLSSCEHGNQGNYWQCASLAEQYNLRWRYVTEAYFVRDRHEKDNTNCHIILAAKTRKGVGDLNFILSEANISGYYYRPRIDLELLLSLDPKDVFVTTACIAGVFKYGEEEATRLILRMAAHFRGSFMLEVQYHDTDKQKELNRFLLRLYRAHGIPLIMGTDSHFIYPEDAVLREHRLEANHIRYEDEGGWYMDYPSGAEAFRRFQEQGVLSDAQIREAMENTNVFLTFEDIVYDKSKKLPTIYPHLTQEQRNQKYMDLILGEFERQTAGMSDEEKAIRMEGLRYEADTVTSTGMSDYFLLDHEIVRRAVEKGGVITKTGRGSAPSYYTNSLLGLSSIDRFAIPVEMFPDRFISADRILSGSLPDIDMNVANREAFEQAQTEVLGEWHAAPMIAFGTLKRLSAWKMYCRAANIPFETANEVGNQLKAYETAVRYAEEGKEIEFADYVPEQFRDLIAASERYMGMIDSISPHPCAYLLCTEDIRREIGIIRINSKTGKKQPVFAAFIDGVTAEQYGYLKNDQLLVDVVHTNQEAFTRIGMKQPDVSTLLDMTRGDRDTWRMYAEGYTMGLNQVEQEKTREKVMRYKPKNITELAAFVAAVRPAFKSMLPTFLERKHFDYGIPAFDKLIQTRDMTSSFILYQEQVMKVLQYAGFTAPESYSAIKAIGKKHPEKVLPLKARFMEGFSAKTDMQSAEKVWKIIEDATSYGFNSCLSGDTRIRRLSSNNKKSGFHPTIAEMYRIRHDAGYAKSTGHSDLHGKYRYQGYGYALSMFDDGRVRKNRIVDIRYSGFCKTYRITTESGATIICTDNHKFPTSNGKKMMRDLCVGDLLYICGNYEKATHRYTQTDGDYHNYPAKGQCGFRETNGPSVVFQEERVANVQSRKACEVCGKPYSEAIRFELHHRDGNRKNNDRSNFLWCCASCHKKAHYALGRTRQMERGYPITLEQIISIEFVKEEDVYDVEMAEPAHNFVVDTNIVTSNSHAVCVALDSLYGAWLKAHHPQEYYTTLLSGYSDKGDKDRIAQVKAEMKRAFGIRVAPCRFRQDNRDYFIDHDANTISDALTSIKHIGKRVAQALYRMRNNEYACFTDLLYDMTMNPAFDSRSIDILIRLDYFREFGSPGKLLGIYREFQEGASRFSKTHVLPTQEKRLASLRTMEQEVPEIKCSLAELLRFEAEHMGTPLTVRESECSVYVVLEVDDRYSPKLRLYSVATGNVGVMKMKKSQYQEQPLSEGNVILVKEWQRRPAYSFSSGKPKPIPSQQELWLLEYTILT